MPTPEASEIAMPAATAHDHDHDEDAVPPGSTDRDLLLYFLKKAEQQRKEQNDATRELSKAIVAHNDAAGKRHETSIAAFTAAAEKAPGRWEFRTLLVAVVMLLAWMIALYAQANGQDAGKAAEDARRALPGSSSSFNALPK